MVPVENRFTGAIVVYNVVVEVLDSLTLRSIFAWRALEATEGGADRENNGDRV